MKEKLEWTTNTPKRGGLVYVPLCFRGSKFPPERGWSNLPTWRFKSDLTRETQEITLQQFFKLFTATKLNCEYPCKILFRKWDFPSTKKWSPKPCGECMLHAMILWNPWSKRMFTLEIHIQLEVHCSNDKQLFNLFPGSTQKTPEGLVFEVLCQYRSTCAAVERNKRPHHNLLPLS